MSDIGLRESVSGPISERSVEVVGVANRRRFTSEYKRRILAEVGSPTACCGFVSIASIWPYFMYSPIHNDMSCSYRQIVCLSVIDPQQAVGDPLANKPSNKKKIKTL